ncbi:MAG TPA: hypothetical protein V6D15_05350 [Oculatellaceae cyanobacterium]
MSPQIQKIYRSDRGSVPTTKLINSSQNQPLQHLHLTLGENRCMQHGCWHPH